MRKAILEKIEDDFDVSLFEKAFNGNDQNNKTYNLEEAKILLGIE